MVRTGPSVSRLVAEEALPTGVVIGTACGWREWLLQRHEREAVAAVRGRLAVVATALVQWQAM